MSIDLKPVDLSAAFESLTQKVLRCKAERDKLLEAAKFAVEELSLHYTGRDLESVRKYREAMRRLTYAIRFAEEQ